MAMLNSYVKLPEGKLSLLSQRLALQSHEHFSSGISNLHMETIQKNLLAVVESWWFQTIPQEPLVILTNMFSS